MYLLVATPAVVRDQHRRHSLQAEVAPTSTRALAMSTRGTPCGEDPSQTHPDGWYPSASTRVDGMGAS